MAATRRRGAALEGAILDAGWKQLLAEGYAGFTFEAIAARAGTGKPVLYRRWPDKETLLLAVLTHQGLGTHVKVPDTGSLREDVLILLRSVNRSGDIVAALLSTIIGAYFNDEISITPAQLRTQLLGDRNQSDALTEVVQHAIDRGEMPPEGLPPWIITLPGDLLRHAVVMNLAPVSDDTIVRIVDTVFLPLVTDPRRWMHS